LRRPSRENLELSATKPAPRSGARRFWLFAFTWCALIAATSSTVVLPHDFFAWVGSRLFTNEAAFRAFVAFWGYSWFAIVKGWHAAEFAILFVLVLLSLDRLAGSRPRRNIVVAFMLCLLFAVSDEYHQTFVPGRGGTCTDVAIDTLGISLAALIASRRRDRPSFKHGSPIDD
jgi:VanZ like family